MLGIIRSKIRQSPREHCIQSIRVPYRCMMLDGCNTVIVLKLLPDTLSYLTAQNFPDLFFNNRNGFSFSSFGYFIPVFPGMGTVIRIKSHLPYLFIKPLNMLLL